MDVEHNIKPKEPLAPGRTQREEKRPLPSDTKTTEISATRKYERTSEIKEKREVNAVGVKTEVPGSQEKGNKTVAGTKNNLKSNETTMRGREVAAPVQDTANASDQFKTRIVTKEHVVHEKTITKQSGTITPPSCPPPRSPSSGHRQLPADPPTKVSQMAKGNITVKSSHTVQGIVERNEQRTPGAKPLSELSSNANTTQQSVTSTSKSTKSRAAPPVPIPRSSGSTSAPVALPRSSGSTGAPVPVPRSPGSTGTPVPVPRSSGSTSGRIQATPSDTSGYPDSFSKRKSRDSREMTDTALNQLGRSLYPSLHLHVYVHRHRVCTLLKV